MGCNCEGKTYNLSFGCCEPVLAPIENYYTKYQIDKMIGSATTSGVTEEQMNEAIASAKTEIEAEIPTIPTSNTAFTNDAGYLTEHQSLSGYATEQWVEDKHYITGVDLSNYATKSEIPIVPTSNTAFTNDAKYITSGDAQTQIDNSISGKADVTSIYTYNGSADNRITVTTAAGIRQKRINFNVPVYSGNNYSAVVLNVPENSVNGNCSIGGGYLVSTLNADEAAFGTYNNSVRTVGDGITFLYSSGNTLFSVGNGHTPNSGGNAQRHNAIEVRQNGDVYIADTSDTTQDAWKQPMIKLQDVIANLQSQIDELRAQIQ